MLARRWPCISVWRQVRVVSNIPIMMGVGIFSKVATSDGCVCFGLRTISLQIKINVTEARRGYILCQATAATSPIKYEVLDADITTATQGCHRGKLTFINTFIQSTLRMILRIHNHGRGSKLPYHCSLGAIGTMSTCEVEELGIKPPTLWSMDDPTVASVA